MKRLLPMAQWLVTLLLCLFLIVPVALSMAVGLTRNYIRSFKERLDLRLGRPGVGDLSRVDLDVAAGGAVHAGDRAGGGRAGRLCAGAPPEPRQPPGRGA